MLIISHLKIFKVKLHIEQYAWNTDTILHVPHFKEAHSLLGEYRLTIIAWSVHDKKEAHIGCCLMRKRENSPWKSWKRSVPPTLLG